jgi:hypothetical protein
MGPPEASDFSEIVDRRLYAEAVSRGIERTPRHVGSGDLSRPVELLATATQLTPALVVFTPAPMHPWSDGCDEHHEALRLARAITAALIRLAHWARQVHGRDVGYDTEVWIEQAVIAGRQLAQEQQHDCALVLDQLEEAAGYLAGAIVALSHDRLAVADCITQAHGAWLAG